MRRLSSALFVLVLLGGAEPVPAGDEPRAVIERALQAMGGVDTVRQRVAIRMKVKGSMASGDARLPLSGELWEAGKRSRLTFHLDLLGNKVRATIVMNDDKSWLEVNGQVNNFSKEDLDSQRASRHQDRVSGLTALLTDKGFTFAPLDDIRVAGRPARGIRVSYKGQPDTMLYFDRETGLLVKYGYRAKKAGDDKEALHETILSDYGAPDVAAADEKVLREAGIGVTGPALLAFLRKQTPNPAALDRGRTLIRKLGDDAFKERERASAELVELGAAVLPLLREAAKNEDREIARRARECLQQIGEQTNQTTVGAVVRLLGLRQPPGTAALLLDYLPAADGEVAREVRAVLFAVAHRAGKPDAALVQALESKAPERRAAAAAALGKDGGAYARLPGRRLFVRPPRIARKHQSWTDGKLQMEMETSDYQFFNAFEDKVFAKP
jgi:hypothetical protein